MDDRLEEILTRLDALERRLDALEARPPERPGPEPRGARCGFVAEERRIVDTIVRLTTESVLRAVDERMERGGPPPDRGGRRRR